MFILKWCGLLFLFIYIFMYLFIFLQGWIWSIALPRSENCKWCLIRNVQFQKISIPTPRGGHWKFQGGGGSEQPKFLKGSMKQNWNFQRGGGLEPKKTLCGRGMDIFWHNTINQAKPCEVTSLSPKHTPSINSAFMTFSSSYFTDLY